MSAFASYAALSHANILIVTCRLPLKIFPYILDRSASNCFMRASCAEEKDCNGSRLMTNTAGLILGAGFGGHVAISLVY